MPNSSMILSTSYLRKCGIMISQCQGDLKKHRSSYVPSGLDHTAMEARTFLGGTLEAPNHL